MSYILYAALAIGFLGLLFGIILAVAARFFAVKGDPRIAMLREALPGANCGGCGYPGCDAFAAAVAAGDAPVNGCPVCSKEAREKLAGIMGIEAGEVEPLVATVMCRGSLENAGVKYDYEGITDCTAAASLAEGYKMCHYSCMGMGNCVRICPTDAITIENGLAHIDQSRCIACGKCAAECPRGIIGLIPKSQQAIVKCRATEKGKSVREACQAGCIGCGICEKKCPVGAIKMVDNLPVIDWDTCIDCGICAENCPRGCIAFVGDRPKVAYIDESKCVGCTLCKKACKFDAIEGELKVAHRVLPEKCVGCGECIKVCRTDAIHMIARKEK